MASVIEELAGGLLITIFLAVLLYGIVSTQTYMYWFNYPEDHKLIRYTVLTVWFLETLHTTFCLHLIYTYMILDFGNVLGVINVVWSAGATVITAVSISAIVQSFFIRRIWILSQRSIAITAIPAVLLFIRVAFGFATASLTWVTGTWVQFRAQEDTFVTLITGLSLAAAVDLVVALLLIYYLQESRTGMNMIDHLVLTLMAYVINTGALTMIVSITIVLTFVFKKDSLMFAGFVEIQSKLYANSFLATLNARHSLSEGNRGTSRSAATVTDGLELTSRRPNIATDSKIGRTSRVSEIGLDGTEHSGSIRSDPAGGFGYLDEASLKKATFDPLV